MKYARMFGWIWLWIWMNANIENSHFNARMKNVANLANKKLHIFHVIVGLFISFRSLFSFSLALNVAASARPLVVNTACGITINSRSWLPFLMNCEQHFYSICDSREITRNASAKNAKINIESNSNQHKLQWHNYAQCCRSAALIDRHNIYSIRYKFVWRANGKNWK